MAAVKAPSFVAGTGSAKICHKMELVQMMWAVDWQWTHVQTFRYNDSQATDTCSWDSDKERVTFNACGYFRMFLFWTWTFLMKNFEERSTIISFELANKKTVQKFIEHLFAPENNNI